MGRRSAWSEPQTPSGRCVPSMVRVMRVLAGDGLGLSAGYDGLLGDGVARDAPDECVDCLRSHTAESQEEQYLR